MSKTEFKPQSEMNNESRLEYYSKALARNQPLTSPEIAEYKDLLKKQHSEIKIPEKDQGTLDFYSSRLEKQSLTEPEWKEYEALLKKYRPSELPLALYQQNLVHDVTPQKVEIDPNEESRLQFYSEALEKDQNLTEPEIAEYKELLRKNKNVVEIPAVDESRIEYYSKALEKQQLTAPEWTEYENLLKKYRPYEVGLAKYKQKTPHGEKPEQEEMDANDKSRLIFYCRRLEKNQLLTPPELAEYKELMKKSKHRIEIPPEDDNRMDYYSKALEKQSLTEPEWKEYETLLKKYTPFEVGLARHRQNSFCGDRPKVELSPNDQSRLELYSSRLVKGQTLTDPELTEYKELLKKVKGNLEIPAMEESRMDYYFKALNNQALTEPEWQEYENLLKKYSPFELGLAISRQHSHKVVQNGQEEQAKEVDPNVQSRLDYYSKALKNNQVLTDPELEEYKQLLRKYEGDPKIPPEDDSRIQYYEKALKKAPLTDPEWAEYEALIKKYKPYELGLSHYLQNIKKNDL